MKFCSSSEHSKQNLRLWGWTWMINLLCSLCSHNSRILIIKLKLADSLVPSASEEFSNLSWGLFQVWQLKQTSVLYYFVLFLWGCFYHLPFSYRSSAFVELKPPQLMSQAGILESKVEVGDILAPVSMSKPLSLGPSLVGTSGNQVAPPDSYAMFRHLMEAKVT